MGLRGALRGRSRPVAVDVDALLTLPNGAAGLRSAAGLVPTGIGSICLTPQRGDALAALQAIAVPLTTVSADRGEPRWSESTDTYGHTWLTRRTPGADLDSLVEDLQAVSRCIAEAGVGAALLCAVVGFSDGIAPTLALIYLYRFGSFYPFAPAGETQRDNERELQLRGILAADLKIEPDLTRWSPVWGAPGL